MGERPLLVKDFLIWTLHMIAQLPLLLVGAIFRKARHFFPVPFIGLFWRLRDALFHRLYLVMAREASRDGKLLLVDAPTERLSAILAAKKARIVSLKSSLFEFQHAAVWLRRSLLSSYVDLEWWRNELFFPEDTFGTVMVFSPLLLNDIASAVRVLQRGGTLLLVERGKLPIHPPSVRDIRWRKTLRIETPTGVLTVYKGVRRG